MTYVGFQLVKFMRCSACQGWWLLRIAYTQYEIDTMDVQAKA